MLFTPRLYQETIAATASLHNTLAVLPTGMGKTLIAMMVAEHRIKQYKKSKVLILAPTKPLADQHAQTFAEHLPDAASLATTLTGKVAPEKRAQAFENATYIFSTPQTIENDLLADRISLQEVSLLVIDEAHRATGDYAYVYICEQYVKNARQERILSLTASPGTSKEQIEEVVSNVHAEKIEVRTAEDPDVKPYVQEMDIAHVEVLLPEELRQIQSIIQRIIRNKLTQVKQFGYVKDTQMNKTQLLLAQKQLQAEIRSGDPDPLVWRSISILAEVMKIQHALELLETQGVSALEVYLHQLQKQASKGQSKAVKNLVAEHDFKDALIKVETLRERGQEHPKFIKLLSLVKLELAKNPDAKIIVFNQYRDMAQKIVEKLGSKSQLFVGQQKKGETGLSQKEQQEMIAQFRDGVFPILVATAVGEEGLDIPAVDLVVFYEPIPSAVRTIQRRGRTGRHKTGRVMMLITKGTRDEGYRWSAHHKEKRMHRVLQEMSTSFVKRKEQKKLADYEHELTIYADTREKGSHVLKELQNIGVKLVLKQLDVGDYVLSNRVAVEFKTAEDFVNSLLDGRLMSQMTALTKYQRPVMIVEGSNWYSQRNVHPNAIRGALAAISVSFGVPILVSQNEKDTAALLYTIARREKEGGAGSAELFTGRPQTPKEELVAVVAAFPGVGPITAPKLLDHFGSVHSLVTASVEQLSEVEGIGKKKAQELYDTFHRSFN